MIPMNLVVHFTVDHRSVSRETNFVSFKIKWCHASGDSWVFPFPVASVSSLNIVKAVDVWEKPDCAFG